MTAGTLGHNYKGHNYITFTLEGGQEGGWTGEGGRADRQAGGQVDRWMDG